MGIWSACLKYQDFEFKFWIRIQKFKYLNSNSKIQISIYLESEAVLLQALHTPPKEGTCHLSLSSAGPLCCFKGRTSGCYIAHEYIWHRFIGTLRSDVDQTLAAFISTSVDKEYAFTLTSAPLSQLVNSKYVVIMQPTMQVRHRIEGFRRRDYAQKFRSGRYTISYSRTQFQSRRSKPVPL